MTTNSPLAARVSTTLANFTNWLDAFGEISLDHQTFFAGSYGRAAKSLYYTRPLLGTMAVAPMIFFEAFIPSARRFFHQPVRFPIADAHFAMGYAFLSEITGSASHLSRAEHFLRVLEETRCPAFKEYCWGYAFDWATRKGLLPRQTPLITTTPYAYEAFLQVDKLDPKEEWRTILASIARHAYFDIKAFETSATASSSSYSPFDEGGVINAAAYRAFTLMSAALEFSNDEYRIAAERNVNFVLDNQNDDGSWNYAQDSERSFIDHFHTCFVMKALGKIYVLTGHKGCRDALERGLVYYQANLFDSEGMPKPFSRAPRLTVYKCELYDCAECINLCLILRDTFPQLNAVLEKVVAGVLDQWVKSDGSFRSRRLHLGWDNVPMHRWAQSQMFRSLAYYLREESMPTKNLTKK